MHMCLLYNIPKMFKQSKKKKGMLSNIPFRSLNVLTLKHLQSNQNYEQSIKDISKLIIFTRYHHYPIPIYFLPDQQPL